MKKVIVLFMLLTILIQSTSQLWIALTFFANRDYIARVLCINRDQPESGCNGSCQLKKQIKKDNDNQEKSHINLKVKDVLVYMVPALVAVHTVSFFSGNEKKFDNIYLCSALPEGVTHPVFHPPASII